MSTLLKKPLEFEDNSDVIEAELNRLLRKRKFAGAPQMSAFLKYVVHQTLAGQADRIKAYSVGVDALGKPDTFDAQSDPSVRVLALRLRKTLDSVYATANDNLAIIDLKVGTYVPEFYKPAMRHTEATPMDGRDNQHESKGISNAGLTKVEVQPSEATGKAIGSGVTVKDVCSANSTCSTRTEGLRRSKSTNPLPEQRSNYDVVKRITNNLNGVVSIRWLMLNKWILLTAVMLLVAAWQISTTQLPKSGVLVGSLQLLPATANINTLTEADDTSSQPNASRSSVSRPLVPTMYVTFATDMPELDRQLTLLFSSSFARAETVSVVRQDDLSVTQNQGFWPGEYRLIVNGVFVGNDFRLDTQIISLSSGELLHTDTVLMPEFEQHFSAHDLLYIESLASTIVSLDGPLVRDYCGQTRDVDHVKCSSI